jgi:hypothetical protein
MFVATGMPKPPGCLLMPQDIQTIHGSQFKTADLIVASPPCQFFKERAARTRADPELLSKELALFKACFRIQREASEAKGEHVPMVVENVKGAQPWVGQARWLFGSFALWGDVPALMPSPWKAVKVGGMGWYPPDDPRWRPGQGFNTLADRRCREEEGRKVPGFRFDGSGRSFQSEAVKSAAEAGGWFGDGNSFGHGRQHAHKSRARKAAAAKIAKIPETLSRHIARVYLP